MAMDSATYMAWFLATAAMTNAVIYGGIALAYFTYKRRGERAAVMRSDASTT
jgi:hypothetical protein